MTTEPLLSVVIVTYNRVPYLRKLLTSLLEQDSTEPYELVLLDNGSEEHIEPLLEDLLSQMPGRLRLLREDRNLLSPARWQQAAEAASGSIILTPGDDDVLLPHYLRTMSDLARSAPDVTMVSGTVTFIDSDGGRLGGRITPPAFWSQPEALGALLCRNDYPMPASGFRRNAVDLTEAPPTRTAFDWWLWIQCWLAGSAAVTNEPLVLYRQHQGQEQRHYGTQSFRTDAARMMLDLVHSQRFREVVDAWSLKDLELFVMTVLGSVGPNYGDTRWGPLVQFALADVLRNRIPAEMVIDLHAQAAAQAGSMASVGDLQAVIGAHLSPGHLPPITWSRVPITASWSSSCHLSTAWSEYLQLPSAPRTSITIGFQCSCETSIDDGHRLTATVRRSDTTSELAVELAALPGDAEAAPLLNAIGSLTGRPHGFEVPATTDLKVLEAFTRFRTSSMGSVIERTARWLKDKRASVGISEGA